MVDSFLSKFLDALVQSDLETAELLFIEEAESSSKDLNILIKAADKLYEVDENKKAAELYSLLLQPAIELNDKKLHLDILKKICLCDSSKKEYRHEFVNTFKQYYADNEVNLAYLKAVDIAKCKTIKEGFNSLDILLQFKEGNYVVHPGGWGIGKISKVSTLTGRLTVDLEKKNGHQVNFLAAASILKPLPKEHFSARYFDRKEDLKKFSEEDPKGMVHLILNSFGSPQTSTDLRERLVPAIIEKPKWSSWWNKAKNSIKKDPYLRLIGGGRPLIELLEKPMSEVDDLVSQFQTGSIKEKFSILKKFKNNKEEDSRAKILSLINKFEEINTKPLETLIMRYRLQDIESKDLAEYLFNKNNGPELVAELKVGDVMREVITVLGKEGDFEQLLPYFLRSKSETVSKSAEILSKKDNERFIDTLKSVFDQPRNFPWPFFWLYTAITDKKWEKISVAFFPQEVLLRLLSLLDFLYREKALDNSKPEIAYGRNLFTKKKLDIFQKILNKTPKESLSVIFSQVIANRTLREDSKIIMREKIAMLSPEAVNQVLQDDKTPVMENDIIYVTKKGFKQRQDEYHRLVNEDIEAAIKEVGKAQEFGDLSENAEWTAALEKRDQLGDRAKEMKEELKKVRFITNDLYHEGHVSLGSEVILKDMTNNHTFTWKILGPWDGNESEGVLNYLSPLGRALLGHREKETIEISIPDGNLNYQVVSISKYDV